MVLYDWANGGPVDVFLDGENGFTSMESYSREMVWNLRTKLCCIAN